MAYVNVEAQDLQIGDFVRGRGRVERDVFDHETRDGVVVVVFRRYGESRLSCFDANQTLSVRCASDED